MHQIKKDYEMEDKYTIDCDLQLLLSGHIKTKQRYIRKES